MADLILPPIDPLPRDVVLRLPWTKAERDLYEAAMGLASLSDDPDEIADTLEWKGVKGALGTDNRGPLINYLKGFCGVFPLTLSMARRMLILDQIPKLPYPKRLFIIKLGRRLRQFVENFEAKKYPNLIG